MSVINQMLKDLDKRNAEENNTSNSVNNGQSPVIVERQSSNTAVIIAVLVSISVTLLLAFGLMQYMENKSLKSALSTSQQAQLNVPSETSVEPKNLDNVKVKAQNAATVKPENAPEAAPSTQVAQARIDKRPAQVSETLADTSDNDEPVQQNAITAPIKLPNSQQLLDVMAKSNTEQAEQKAPTKKLVIARKQLTPVELAAQKMKQAEKAVFDKDVQKAEQLFQDILLLTPDNKAARQQLAALWYGQQSYQPAINLLAQGIHATPEDADYRLMSAKIYIAQQQTQNAYRVLQPLADVAEIEYQSLLASTSQTLQQHQSAIKAYQKLVQLQPSKSQWHLGLAIALDSDSQFLPAVQAYQQALNLGDLSNNSQAFITQRLQALGE